METVSVWKAFTFGIKAFVKKPLFFLGASVFSILFYGPGFLLNMAAFFMLHGSGKTLGIFKKYFSSDVSVIWPISFYVCGFLLLSFVGIVWVKIGVDFVDKGESSFGSFFVKLSDFLKFYAMKIFLFVPVFVGPLVMKILVGKSFFLIPAAIIAVLLYLMFGFAGYFIIDEKLGILESLRKSFRLKGGAFSLFKLSLLFYLFEICIKLFSSVFYVIPYIPGLVFVTLSMIAQFALTFLHWVSTAYLYRKLHVGQKS